MTAIRTGDRVKVKIDAEGTVAHSNGGGTYDVRFEGRAAALEYVPAEWLEKIPEPAKVGDVVNGLPGMPVGSVVLELKRGGGEYLAAAAADAVWTRYGSGWRSGFIGDTHSPGEFLDVRFRVLHVVPAA